MNHLVPAKSSPPVLNLLCAAFISIVTTHLASAQSSGQQDPSFAVGNGGNGVVAAVALQSNGKVLVGGNFTTFDGTNCNALARLNTDGSRDTFNPGLALGDNAAINAVALQANGQIIVGGGFTVLDQPSGGGVARLNADGSLDSTFNVGSGAGASTIYASPGTALALVVLSNGQILVGGGFVSFNGVNTAGLVRLNSNGSVDTTFNPGGAGITSNAYGESVNCIVVEPNGSIYIAGNFSTYDGHSANSVARLHPNGTLDATFNVGDGIDDGGATALAVQANGQVLVGGGFQTFDSVSVPYLVRLDTDGSLDTSYLPSGDYSIYGIGALLVQPDGSVLAGGDLVYAPPNALTTTPENGLVRLEADGTEDPGFNGGDPSNVVALAQQSDGKVVVASNTSNVSGGNVLRYDTFTPFFFGGVALGNGVYYLSFTASDYFGYYTYLTDSHYIYHFDLGYEYVFDAADGHGGVYFYDFKSNTFFYTSPVFAFPYLYDFTLDSTLYYYPDPSHPGRYNTNGIRYFYEFKTGKIISK